MKFIKKLFGIDKIEAQTIAAIAEAEKAKQLAEAATAAAERATEAERQSKLTPKERATAKGEPWVSVLDTHVNKDNIRNGFFELDWNELFVVQLKQAGYGFDGDPDEEIVDRWFRDIVKNMLADEGLDPNRGAGYINVVPIAKGKSEVS
jgi:ssDNA-specific exonuclease RecJ